MRLLSWVLLLGLGSCGWVHTVRGQATSEDVQIDLQPCVIAGATIEKDVSGVTEAYLFQEFFKGFWSSSQHYMIAPSGTLDLTVDENHGRCNLVLVATPVTDDQLAQLREYSQRFQVRLVYFDEALMANDADLMGQLGLTQYFAEPLLDIPHIQLTGKNMGSMRRSFPQVSSPPPPRVKPEGAGRKKLRRTSLTTEPRVPLLTTLVGATGTAPSILELYSQVLHLPL